MPGGSGQVSSFSWQATSRGVTSCCEESCGGGETPTTGNIDSGVLEHSASGFMGDSAIAVVAMTALCMVVSGKLPVSPRNWRPKK